jgi:hypothetical protein
MDSNAYLNKRPLTEVVIKHGSSKLFLSAIILAFVYIGLNLLYSIFTAVSSLNTSIPFVDASVLIDEGYYVITIVSALIAVVNSILSFIQYGYLYSAYCFFSGRSNNPNGLKTFTKIFLAQMIIVIAEMPLAVLGVLFAIDDSNDAYGVKGAIIFITAIILIPIIAGVIVLSIFQYKGIKKSVNHAMAAYENRNVGGVSTFVIVMAFIVAVGGGISLITQLSSAVLSASFGMYAIITTISSIVIQALQITSLIMFIVLIFRYKNDIENAKGEWFYIERQKAQIRAQEYAAQQEASQNSDV